MLEPQNFPERLPGLAWQGERQLLFRLTHSPEPVLSRVVLLSKEGWGSNAVQTTKSQQFRETIIDHSCPVLETLLHPSRGSLLLYRGESTPCTPAFIGEHQKGGLLQSRVLRSLSKQEASTLSPHLNPAQISKTRLEFRIVLCQLFPHLIST